MTVKKILPKKKIPKSKKTEPIFPKPANGELITTATSIKNLRGHIGIQGELGLLVFRKISVEPL